MLLNERDPARKKLEGPPAFDPAFQADVIAGLSCELKAIPARWLYDHHGSQLFEAITEVEEYYPTRVERGILANAAGELAGLVGPGAALVEFGSGSSAKTPLVVDAIRPAAYVPIDISGDFLRESAEALSAEFPTLPVYPLEGDFLKPLTLPREIADKPRVGFFPGSTIGNLTPASAIDLLRVMARTLGRGAQLLIGIDRIKAEDVLVRAYDDEQGVTASFNLNLLARINREIGGTIPVDAFRHLARWNGSQSRIEMHLEAVRDVAFEVSGTRFALKAGETIHTENSHKYSPTNARLLLRAAGWSPIADWTDEGRLFSVLLCKAAPEPFAP